MQFNAYATDSLWELKVREKKSRYIKEYILKVVVVCVHCPTESTETDTASLSHTQMKPLTFFPL